MVTLWTYRLDGNDLDIEDENGCGRVLELYSSEDLAVKKCRSGRTVVAITHAELNSVHRKEQMYGVYLDGKLMVWPDFGKYCNPSLPESGS